MSEDTTVPIEITVPEPFLDRTGLGDDKEGYGVSQATIRMSITLHPDDGDERGRLVTIAATTHEDAPIVAATRFSEISPLPTAISEVLQSLIGALPERERMAIERYKLAQTDAMRKASEKKASAAAAASRSAKAKPAAAGKAANAAPAKTAATVAATTEPERPATCSLPLFSEE